MGQYWELQEGQKRQRKSLEHFKVEVVKVKDVEMKKGAGESRVVLRRAQVHCTGASLFGKQAIETWVSMPPGKALKDIPVVVNFVGGCTPSKRPTRMTPSRFVVPFCLVPASEGEPVIAC